MAVVSVPSSFSEFPAARTASLLRTLVVVGAAALVTACGGGGGGGGGGSKSDPNLVVPVAAGYTSLITSGANEAASLVAELDGEELKGDATINISQLSATLFEGQVAQASTLTLNGTLRVDGDSIPLPPFINTTYFDSNYKELGAVVTDAQSNIDAYSVVTSANPLPATGKVGDGGPLATYTTYTGASKISAVGTINSRYSIIEWTNNTVILQIILDFRNQSQTLLETDTYNYRIDAAGKTNLEWIEIATADGLRMTFTPK